MILINLLPHREEARRRRKAAFNTTLGVSALAGVGIVALGFGLLQAQISSQQERNTFLRSEISALDVQIKQIATLQADITALRARQDAVEGLQADRNQPVNLLNELVRQVPDGVYLTSLKQTGQTVTLSGEAQSNERVSELLRNLGNNSPWLYQPQLGEIVASTTKVSDRDQRRTAAFKMTVQIRRASDDSSKANPGAPGAIPAKPGA